MQHVVLVANHIKRNANNNEFNIYKRKVYDYINENCVNIYRG